MPKVKTNKAAKKRYSYTATNKVKRTKANRRHRLATKTNRQRKSLSFTLWLFSLYKLFC